MSRTCKRSRIAVSVRPCLSAISVTLFPASTNSRSCFSSSGSHRRLALRVPLIIRPAVLRDADLSGQARARRRSYRAPLADVPRSAPRRGVRAQYIPQDAPGVLNGTHQRILIRIIHDSTELYRMAIQSREGQIRSTRAASFAKAAAKLRA